MTEHLGTPLARPHQERGRAARRVGSAEELVEEALVLLLAVVAVVALAVVAVVAGAVLRLRCAVGSCGGGVRGLAVPGRRRGRVATTGAGRGRRRGVTTRTRCRRRGLRGAR